MSPRVSAQKREKYVQDRRNQILDAAIEVFAEKGLDVATMDEIAGAVGVSKGTIYLYFKSKNEIFDTILTERSSVSVLTDFLARQRRAPAPGYVPLQEFFEQIGYKFLEDMDKFVPIFRLVLADARRFPRQAERVYNNLILKANRILADYLEEQAQAGVIRPLKNPLVTARCLVGMLLIYVLSQEMLGGKKYTPIKPRVWVREAVKIFLEGVGTGK